MSLSFMLQAYGSGCDVVILASDFECVQIIPGAQNGNIQVGCVECSHQLGRVSNRPRRRTCDFSFHSDTSRRRTRDLFTAVQLSPPSTSHCLPPPPLPPLREWLRCTDGVTNIGMMNADFFFSVLFLDRCLLRKHSLHL